MSAGIERQPAYTDRKNRWACEQPGVLRIQAGESVSNNLLHLEVREEILGTQMDDKRSNGPRLVEGIVNEKSSIGQDIGSSHPMAAPHSRNHGDVVRGVISCWLDDQDVVKGQFNSVVTWH